MKNLCILLCSIWFLESCNGQIESPTSHETDTSTIEKSPSEVEIYYQTHFQDSLESESVGTVSNGSLKHGTVLPFYGENYSYFDQESYLAGRAFMHTKVAKSIIDSYEILDSISPEMHYIYMECSNEHGGKLHPHRTHQNGLSVDFMVPLLKNGERYTDLDSLGKMHYLLEFDDSGKLKSDTSISLDFDRIGEHILELQEAANNHDLKISKVIFKMELMDELFKSKYGKELKQSGIYFTRQLTPLINSLHDDHYHIDFEEVR